MGKFVTSPLAFAPIPAMNTLSQKLSRWLSGTPSKAELDRWQRLARETSATSQAEWHLSGTRGPVSWRLPSLFADGEINPKEEYLRWQAIGLPKGLRLEIVPREQYDAWIKRSLPHDEAAVDASQDTTLAKALSVFTETLRLEETARLSEWAPVQGGFSVVEPIETSLEAFTMGWTVTASEPTVARRMVSPRFQAHWVQTSRLLTDAKCREATDLRLRIVDGTAQLHTARAHRNMPLEAVQSLVDLGLSLLDSLEKPAADLR